MNGTVPNPPPKVAIIISNWYGASLQNAEGVLRYAQVENTIDPLLFIGDTAIDDFLHSKPESFAGVISEAMDLRLAQTLRQLRLPNVLFDLHRTIDKHSVQINCNDVEIGRKAAEFCLAKGFRSCAFIDPATHKLWAKIRKREFKRTVLSAHASFSAITKGSRKGLERFLRGLPPDTAVFCAHDRLALEVINCCKRIERRIPEDLVVMGADNDRLICEYTMPRLTSISIEHRQAGEIAAKTLTQMLNGENPPSVLEYKCGAVIERDSTHRTSAMAPHVAFCEKFISNNAEGTINIAELVQHVGYSRRKLEIDFKTITGQTLHEAIYRAKVNRAKTLVASTSFTLASIAERCGFSSASHMTMAFNRILRKPPSSFR